MATKPTENIGQASPVVELAYAYEDVFGREGKRSASQQKVWDDMMESSYYARTTFVQNPRTGELSRNGGQSASTETKEITQPTHVRSVIARLRRHL